MFPIRRATLSPAFIVCGLWLIDLPSVGSGAELWIGCASTSITPSEPVALSGQFATRIGRNVESPVAATALAIEARQDEESTDQAVLVACDLVAIRGDIQEQVRRAVQSQVSDLDATKIVLSATHTHTAPVMLEGIYQIPEDGVMSPSEYVQFLVEQLSALIVDVWKSRQPGSVSWGLGHAVVAQNRRAVYADGSAKMYGKTNIPAFRQIEGYEDHGVEVLFFWNRQDALLATAVNVACPAQEVESRSAVNADFWHEVRLQLGHCYGEELNVLGWTGASGDQSPHLMWRKRAEERMRSARGLTRLEEIARRLSRAVEEAHEVAKDDIQQDVPFVHLTQQIQLPVRMVTEQEYQEAKQTMASLAEQESQGRDTRMRRQWHQATVERYERQMEERHYKMQLHVIRIGDVAICTNPFELYTDFGVQIKARSQALQTFVIQLAGTSGKYLATAEAIRGGSYSTGVNSCLVGPEGGQVLVDKTVEAINSLW
jgi:hypothetical protein